MSQFKGVADGIFIGPQPTQQNLEDAKQQGIKTVIDLRMPAETTTSNETLTKSHGLGYVNIPVNYQDLSVNQIDELDAAMKGKEGPFLLHCATGARVALLLSLSRARQNDWTTEQAFAEAKRMGFDLKTSHEFSTFVAQTIIHNRPSRVKTFTPYNSAIALKKGEKANAGGMTSPSLVTTK